MKRRKRKKIESSKIIAFAIIITCLVDLQLPFVLSAFGKEPLENLAIAIVTTIIASDVVYNRKAFLGKKEEEKVRLMEKLMKKKEEFDKIINEEGEENDI